MDDIGIEDFGGVNENEGYRLAMVQHIQAYQNQREGGFRAWAHNRVPLVIRPIDEINMIAPLQDVQMAGEALDDPGIALQDVVRTAPLPISKVDARAGLLSLPISCFINGVNYLDEQCSDLIEGRYLYTSPAAERQFIVFDVQHLTHKILDLASDPELPQCHKIAFRSLTPTIGVVIETIHMRFRAYDKLRNVMFARLVEFQVAEGTFTYLAKPARWISGYGRQCYSIADQQYFIAVQRPNERRSTATQGRIYKVDPTANDDRWLQLINMFDVDANIDKLFHLSLPQDRLFYVTFANAGTNIAYQPLHTELEDKRGNLKYKRQDRSFRICMPRVGLSANPETPDANITQAFSIACRGVCHERDYFCVVRMTTTSAYQRLCKISLETGAVEVVNVRLPLAEYDGPVHMGVDAARNEIVLLYGAIKEMTQKLLPNGTTEMQLRMFDVYRIRISDYSTADLQFYQPKSLRDLSLEYVRSKPALAISHKLMPCLRPFFGLLNQESLQTSMQQQS